MIVVAKICVHVMGTSIDFIFLSTYVITCI